MALFGRCQRPIIAVATTMLVLQLPAGNSHAAGIFSDTGYFPLAVWLQSPPNAKTYRATGVNLFVGLWNGPVKADLDTLEAANMPVLCDQNAFALANLTTYAGILAGWTQGDEPDNAQDNGAGGYNPCISPDTIIGFYDAWKNADPTRPVYLNLGQGVSYIDYIGRGSACYARTDMYPRYLQGCDIASFDIYPVNSSYAAVQGNLWYVAKGVDSLLMWSNNAKPVWAWIECTRIDSSSSAKPTPAQTKAEVWMAIIHGASGIGYFCHSWYGGFQEAAWLSDPPMKSALTALNHRIDTLAPVLKGATLSGRATVQSSNSAVPIDILVKSHGGATYVFAVAMRNDTATAHIALNGLSGAASATVLDENRSIAVSNGSFSDTFTGYGVHLYKINMPLAALFSAGAVRATGFRPQLVVGKDGNMMVVSSAEHNDDRGRASYSVQGRLVRAEARMPIRP
jgi:hypothetical protein